MKHQKSIQKSESTRRRFLQSTGVLAAGLSMRSRRAAGAQRETLAISGGPEAVTYPDDQHRQAYRWPLYERVPTV